jgi:hypothetical protein
MRARGGERRQQSFEQMCERQARVLPDATAPAVERTVLTREIRLMCLHGLLLCLDREHRLGCRCELWCEPALEAGVVEPDHPKLAGHPADGDPGEDLEQRLAGLDELQRIGVLFRSLPAYRAPDRLVNELSHMLTVERDRTPRA